MRCCLILTILTILALFIFVSLVRADSIYIISYSPDGQTSLISDGQRVIITHDGVEISLPQPDIIAFAWMDNQSALMNRSDYGVLIVNVITHQVFWLGYNYPDTYCSPCNIGGEG